MFENGSDKVVKVTCNQPGRELNVYFKTADTKKPLLLFEESADHPDEVACFASFLPTFEPKQPQEVCEVVEDEEPESIDLKTGKKFLYMFIVDRSGSMRGIRMTKTIEALVLFL